MKTKAAVAVAARSPLESGVCHTDEFTRSGADPEGLFAPIRSVLVYS